MMKVAIFGATGKTGMLIVERSFALGWQVTALARQPGKLAAMADVRVVIGYADQPDAILDTLQGAERIEASVIAEMAALGFFGMVVPSDLDGFGADEGSRAALPA